MTIPSLAHLKATFDDAEKRHPDLMERYAQRLLEAETAQEKIEAMRSGLRETFRARYPMPEGLGWPGDAIPCEVINGPA